MGKTCLYAVVALLLAVFLSLNPALADDKAGDYISIFLPASGEPDKTWKYTLSQPEVAAQIEFNDLRDAHYQRTGQMLDGPIPGYFCFYFTGLKAGETDIVFDYVKMDDPQAQPEKSAIYKVAVNADKTLRIISAPQ